MSSGNSIRTEEVEMSKLNIEVLSSPAEVSRIPPDRSELDRLVQQKGSDILQGRDAFVFQPFFQINRIAQELKRLQTVSEQRKWKVYFQRWGCLICETTSRIHVGNGMCDRCY